MPTWESASLSVYCNRYSQRHDGLPHSARHISSSLPAAYKLGALAERDGEARRLLIEYEKSKKRTLRLVGGQPAETEEQVSSTDSDVTL